MRRAGQNHRLQGFANIPIRITCRLLARGPESMARLIIRVRQGGFRTEQPPSARDMIRAILDSGPAAKSRQVILIGIFGKTL